MATRKAQAIKFRELMEAASAYLIEEKPKTESPTELVDIMRPLVVDLVQETFFVVLLNAKNRVIKIEVATVGLVDRTQIHAREVFREAIVNNASRIIICHNHPSGDPTPSSQDISATRDLIGAGKIIGIEILDHIVMGKKTEKRQKDFLSFREEGLL